jgi:hypothetical protein
LCGGVSAGKAGQLARDRITESLLYYVLGFGFHPEDSAKALKNCKVQGRAFDKIQVSVLGRPWQ